MVDSAKDTLGVGCSESFFGDEEYSGKRRICARSVYSSNNDNSQYEASAKTPGDTMNTDIHSADKISSVKIQMIRK